MAARAEGLPLDPARETAIAAAFANLQASPPELRMFLRAMPKGADLHNHLGGAIYAEDMLEWAGARGFCMAADGQGVEPPPCPPGRALPRIAQHDEFGFDRLIDSLSTRGWQRGVGAATASGHRQFFSSFERFAPLQAGTGAQILATARRTAAGDNLSYLELGHNPGVLGPVVMAAGEAPLAEADLARRYAAEIIALAPEVPRARAELDGDEAAVGRLMACGTPSAEAGCG
ncbi:MAG TPA: adenosine deaminase, partial [Novosphingobium sp.]